MVFHNRGGNIEKCLIKCLYPDTLILVSRLKMLRICALALCLGLALGSSEPTINPDFYTENGGLSHLEFEFGTHSEPLPRFNSWHVKVHVPSSCNETIGLATASRGCPVFVFSAAVPGSISNIRYDRQFEAMATHGVITVSTATDTTSVDFEAFARDLEPVLDYVFASTNGLQDNITALGVPGKARLDKIFFGGHGQGARIMLHRATQNPCEGGALGGMIMYSPVEDYQIDVNLGQGTIIPDHPRDNVPWVMPGLLLMTELDGTRADSNTPPCAPADASNFRFFDKWRGPIWQTQSNNFGFLDMTFSTSPYFFEDLCANSENEGDPPFDGNQRTQNRQVVTASTLHFMNYLLFQNSGSRQFLTPTRPADVKQTLNGLEIYERRTGNLEDGEVVTASCTYDPDRFPWTTRLVLIIIGAFCGFMSTFGVGLWYFYLRKRGPDLTELEFEKLAEKHGTIVPGFGAVKEGGVTFQADENPGPSALDLLDQETVPASVSAGIPSGAHSRIPSNYGLESGTVLSVPPPSAGSSPPPSAGRESTDMVPFSVTTNFSTGETPGDADLESSFPDGQNNKSNNNGDEEDIF